MKLSKAFSPRFFLIALLSLALVKSKGQNKIVDFDAINSWQSVSRYAHLSNDGRFLAYALEGSGIKNRVIVKSVKEKWEKQFDGVAIADTRMTEDSKFVIFRTGKDSLAIHTLGKNNCYYINSVLRWDLAGSVTCQKLVYLNTANQLVLFDIRTKTKNVFNDVNDFALNNAGNAMVLTISDSSLVWLDIVSGRTQILYKGSTFGKLHFDSRGRKMAYLAKNIDGKMELLIYDSINKISHNLTKLIPVYKDGVGLSAIKKFSGNDSTLYVTLQAPNKWAEDRKTDVADVCIWGTEDVEKTLVFKYSNDLPLQERPREFLGMVSIFKKQFDRLEEGDTTASEIDRFSNPDWFIRSVKQQRSATGFWNELISGNTRKIWSLKNISPNIGSYIKVSPSGRYLVYFDINALKYFSYDVNKNQTVELGRGSVKQWVNSRLIDIGGTVSSSKCLGWLRKGAEELVFLSDGYDVWLVNLTKIAAPINITLGKGRRNKWVFNFVDNADLENYGKKPILISVFDERTKLFGFGFVSKSGSLDTTSYQLAPYFYYGVEGMAFRGNGSDFIPIKAKNSPVYLFKRMAVNQSPNYFTTTDFKSIKPQSDVYPEKKYNWPKSELLKWKTNSGTEVDGALFTPSDFDSTKKYPVIINYYEKDADGLNVFRKPELMTYDINIPWFVSRGYLVLMADIHYTVGKPGESAFDCINSAADKLATLSYVDKSKIGIEGHSFGGYETNYILTRTGRFAAASSGAGISDLISFYGDYLPAFRFSLQTMVEKQQFRMSANPWEKRKDYLDNSPILNADKINTPLLLMHNFKDGNVPFKEGEALFMALRRLKKIAWLLQYDNGDHVLSTDKDSRDYTTRVTQFFNHYLKGEDMPAWMKSKDGAQFKRFLD